MAATLKEIAKIANVNISTVSRALNGESVISDETKARVLKIAEEIGYRPNYLAKSLKSGSSKTICLLVPDIGNLIFPQITRGVEDAARENGYTVVLCNSNDDPVTEKYYIDSMIERQIDGYVICSAQHGEENILFMVDQLIPCAIVNRYKEQFLGKIDCVGINNYQAAYDTVNYLYSRGYRKIAFAKGNQDLIFNYDRFHGYMDALRDLGLEMRDEWIMEKDDDNFYDETVAMMNLDRKPDCIFAGTDPKAFTIMKALLDMHYRIPEDIGVMGFDNVSLAEIYNPSLSTVAQPLYEFGKIACTAVIKQIKHKKRTGELPKPRTHFLDYKLMIRDTTK